MNISLVSEFDLSNKVFVSLSSIPYMYVMVVKISTKIIFFEFLNNHPNLTVKRFTVITKNFTSIKLIKLLAYFFMSSILNDFQPTKLNYAITYTCEIL